MLNLKNALRGLVLAWVLLPTQSVLAGCLDTDANGNRIFSSDGVNINQNLGIDSFATDTACAAGKETVAVGHLAFGYESNSVIVGNRAMTDRGSQNTIAIGSNSFVGRRGPNSFHGGIALGSHSRVNPNHAGGVAIGRYAQTSAQLQFAFGTSARDFTLNINADGSLTGTSFAGIGRTYRNTYRFAGLAIAEDDLGLAAEFARVTSTELNPVKFGANFNAERKALYDRVVARDAEVARLRGLRANRVLGVNGHGDLVSLGDVSEFMGGGGGISAATQAKIDAIGSSDDAADASGSLYARINKNRADIASFQSAGVSSETMAQIQGNTAQGQKNAQGVALGNALSAIPNTLNPGKKLFLGLGVGSFDGKSATAIGVTGKFGASTLLNAGFATGGGESSTRIGIGWEF